MAISLSNLQGERIINYEFKKSTIKIYHLSSLAQCDKQHNTCIKGIIQTQPFSTVEFSSLTLRIGWSWAEGRCSIFWCKTTSATDDNAGKATTLPHGRKNKHHSTFFLAALFFSRFGHT